MAEFNETKTVRARGVRHSGRDSQVLIYLGKQFRFFVNENDWKVLPMAAIIAALVSMVIRRKFFINMEGSLIGGFALTCVAIWNGCFNSIQAVCRERPIIKREHRSGMHITSYVAAHMIYQFLLCAAQTALSIYVLVLMEVPIPAKGFMTPWMVVDLGISMLLISYASDMMSLFISSISHTTTGAMTVMPFVLIFQLVFSGGVIPLPAWAQVYSNYTISNYGMKAIISQSGYNELPMETGWKTLNSMRNREIGGTFTLGQVLDLLDSPAIESRRDMEVMKSMTLGEAAEILNKADGTLHIRDTVVTRPITVKSLLELLNSTEIMQKIGSIPLLPDSVFTQQVTVSELLQSLLTNPDNAPLLEKEIGMNLTLGQVLDLIHAQELTNTFQDQKLNDTITLGNIVDFLKNNEAIQARRDQTFTLKTTFGELFSLFGEQEVQRLVEQKTAEASRKPEYARTEENIVHNWLMLGVFIFGFALASILVLELIDKDKR